MSGEQLAICFLACFAGFLLGVILGYSFGAQDKEDPPHAP